MSKQEEEVSNWSELCPELLQEVCNNRLSFTELSRSKSVCSSWNSGSEGCVPKQNQIPWLILLPTYNFNNNNNSSCALFVPDDKQNVYKTRDLGVDFVENRFLATYSSWLLMLNPRVNLYILNPLTGERIDLPYTKGELLESKRASFWIDNKTKDYLIVLVSKDSFVFTKKGDNKWNEFPGIHNHIWFDSKIVYNHKNRKLYAYRPKYLIKIWDFSGDKPQQDGYLDYFRLIKDNYDLITWENLVEIKRSLAVTISGDFLMVSCCIDSDYNKTWRFRIYKANQLNRKWVEIDSLGDEALILDMGVTVVAKEGIKKNSIYFSGMDYERYNLDKLFVFDLTTQSIDRLPKCVFSSVQFSDARWFFPGFNG